MLSLKIIQMLSGVKAVTSKVKDDPLFFPHRHRIM